MSTLLPIILRVLGLSKITPWALVILPYITQYLPVVIKFLDDAKASWTTFKSEHPWLSKQIEYLASKLLPQLPTPDAAMITLRGIFAPRTLDEQQQDLWRKADGTEPVNKDLGDFPRNPMT